MRRAQLVEAVAFGEIGHEVHLLGGMSPGIWPIGFKLMLAIA
jgi:hypothetical protein